MMALLIISGAILFLLILSVILGRSINKRDIVKVIDDNPYNKYRKDCTSI